MLSSPLVKDSHLNLEMASIDDASIVEELPQSSSIGREKNYLPEVLPDTMLSQHKPIKAGYVEKRFRARKQWKTRWLVLRNHYLSVYKDEKEYELKNSLDLYRTSVISQVEKKKRKFVFGIQTPQKKYYFQCQSENEMNEWIRVLCQARDSQSTESSSTSNPIPIKGREEQKMQNDTDHSWDSRHRSCGSSSSHLSDDLPYQLECGELVSDSSDNEPISELPHLSSGSPLTPPLSTPNLDFETLAISGANQSDSKAIHQGLLYKHCEGFRSWRKRWFVLRNSHLCYYKNEKEYELLAMIPLDSISEVSLATTSSKAKVFCFKVVNDKRSYKLAALTESDRDQWIQYLQEKIAPES